MPRDGLQILVAAAGEIDHHQMILRLFRRELQNLGDGVRGLQRRDDALKLGQERKGVQRLVIGRRQKGDAADVVQP